MTTHQTWTPNAIEALMAECAKANPKSAGNNVNLRSEPDLSPFTTLLDSANKCWGHLNSHFQNACRLATIQLSYPHEPDKDKTSELAKLAKDIRSQQIGPFAFSQRVPFIMQSNSTEPIANADDAKTNKLRNIPNWLASALLALQYSSTDALLNFITLAENLANGRLPTAVLTRLDESPSNIFSLPAWWIELTKASVDQNIKLDKIFDETSVNPFCESLRNIFCIYIAWGVREKGLEKGAPPHSHLPFPTLYFVPESSNSKIDNQINDNPNTEYEKCIVWSQFNSIARVERKHYPFINLLSESENAISDHRGNLFYNLMQQSIQEEAFRAVSADHFLLRRFGEKVRNFRELETEHRKEGPSQAYLLPIYHLLSELAHKTKTASKVGMEEQYRIYPGISVDVAETALPTTSFDIWNTYRTYLGEGDWGLVNDISRYLFGESGPSAHLVILLGPYGTGKTSIAQALVQRLVSMDSPDWYVVSPKAEGNALELLPVNRYNIFYLFKRSELSRVPIQERLANLDYYIPPDKNIVINLAELNAVDANQLKMQLSGVEMMLRELREKALPRRVVVLLAMNYLGVFQELASFLLQRPDLYAAGARLSHLWVVQASPNQGIQIPKDKDNWISVSSKEIKQHENLAQATINLLKEDQFNNLSEQLAYLKNLLEDSNLLEVALKIKLIDAWGLRNQLYLKEYGQKLFLKHYFRYRFMGRDYLADPSLAGLYLTDDLIDALYDDPIPAGSNKQLRKRNERRGDAEIRIRLWENKGNFLFRSLNDHPKPQIIPLLVEMGLRARYPIEEVDATIRKDASEAYKRILQAWGIEGMSLAHYLGTSQIMKLNLDQGFIRNLHEYLARELELRLVERQIMVDLASEMDLAPISKYHELIAISELTEGIFTTKGIVRILSNNIADTEEQITHEDVWHSLKKSFSLDSNNVATIDYVCIPEWGGNGKASWIIGFDKNKTLYRSAISDVGVPDERHYKLVSLPFSGHDSSKYDCAYYIEHGDNKQPILILVDITKGLEEHNKTKAATSMTIGDGKNPLSSLWQLGRDIVFLVRNCATDKQNSPTIWVFDINVSEGISYKPSLLEVTQVNIGIYPKDKDSVHLPRKPEKDASQFLKKVHENLELWINK